MKTLKIAAVCVIGMLPFTILNAQTPPRPPMDEPMGVSGDKANKVYMPDKKQGQIRR